MTWHVAAISAFLYTDLLAPIQPRQKGTKNKGCCSPAVSAPCMTTQECYWMTPCQEDEKQLSNTREKTLTLKQILLYATKKGCKQILKQISVLKIFAEKQSGESTGSDSLWCSSSTLPLYPDVCSDETMIQSRGSFHLCSSLAWGKIT